MRGAMHMDFIAPRIRLNRELAMASRRIVNNTDPARIM
jgi:hypothetical protein